MKDREHSGKSRPAGTWAGFVAAQFFWAGPGELVALGVLRTGRIGIEALLPALALLLTAGTSVTSVRLGLRAAIDLVARALFLPSHGWSAAVMLLDLVVVAAAWFAAGLRRESR
ncbi:hypothetical protein ABJI51_30595 [Amycolatopsis sp. NEAU-NG30]|uniref:Uncharacterized protein n=1 Tax=Amycolatopsis melonis TaxID=3156488 RepID=A0ABV0LMB0_9PSEU